MKFVKLKYYLRGLGIGIIVTTIILMISFSQRETNIPDDEIIARAIQLGMVMPEEKVTEEKQTQMPETQIPESESQAQEPGTQTPESQTQEPQTQTQEPQTQEPQTQMPESQTQEPGAQDAADAQTGTYRLTIQKGDVCRVVCENLAANGVIEDAEALRKYLFEIGYASKMSTGEYDIPYGLTLEEVAEILKNGPIAM